MQAEFLVGRDTEMELATKILRQDGTGAVLIVADPGMGKTALAAGIAADLGKDMVVLQVHGSPSLSTVPYGVLTPYLLDLPVEQATSPVAILREFWSQFEKRRAGNGARLLLVVDDAHLVDEGSTQIMAELVTAGWARLVATSKPRPGLPPALLQLWYDGLAERLELHPLEKDTVGEFAEKALGGPVMATVTDVLHVATEGNPLLLRTLVDDATADGSLVRRNGTWLLTRPLPAGGDGLADVMRNRILRAGDAEREAMQVVALAEPIPAAVLDNHVGRDAVRVLMDSGMVVSTDGPGSPVKMRHAVYGEALRHLISPARSLQVRQRLEPRLAVDPSTPEGFLRMVEWALDCGDDVDDEQLLQAAFLAIKQHRFALALAAARKVRSEGLRSRARMVTAMVHFNDGDFQGAARLLEDGAGFLDADPSGPLGAGLLWAEARTRAGEPFAGILAQAEAAARVAAAEVQDGDPLAGRIQRTLRALTLTQLARNGKYSELAPELDRFMADVDAAGPEAIVERIVALATRCELLTADGVAAQAMQAGREALLLVEQHGGDLLHIPHIVALRYVLAALGAGDWESADAVLDLFADGSAAGPVVFGGGVHVLKGLSSLRQGRLEQATAQLMPAVEALQVADPLGLGALGNALAFYAAARSGDSAAVARLAPHPAQDGNGAGNYADALARLYVLAGQEVLEPGKGLAALQQLPESGGLYQRPGVLLQNLVLRAELGDPLASTGISGTAAGMEGNWAAAWRSMAAAHLGGDGQGLVNAGNFLAAAGMPGPAAAAFDEAAVTFDAQGKRPEARQAAALRDVSEANLGDASAHDPQVEAGRAVPLTRRERDIVALAVSGLTDRQIAENLMVSVRTVEGHLYRSYAKLGIRRREDLGNAIGP
ncbi:AAA family ATPase [Paenarthrobacter ilicis]|uniref:helix-turn-helix transcriptional regulator n=1 Tax=Paenarthrobacter ilicis TaxID=43665 RepID=UPI003865E78A